MPSSQPWAFPWPADRIPHYTAYRVDVAPTIDGRLDERAWQLAPRSNRFVDLISGADAIHDTHAAVLWDDDNLYIGFWVEEPLVTATLTERDSLIYTDNDVEVFIAGAHCYYEFEINAFGTVYEAFFVWARDYAAQGFAADPLLARDVTGYEPFNGVGFTNHPRGPRLGFWRWDLPGLQTAVHVDGVINDPTYRDRGWTVELAFPWQGLQALLRGEERTAPPRAGDVWRIDCSRFNQYKAAPPAEDAGGWAWGAHGVWDSHIPELFPFVHFSDTLVTERS